MNTLAAPTMPLLREELAGSPQVSLRRGRGIGPGNARIRRPRRYHFVESQPQRQREQRVTQRLSEDIVPGMRKDKFVHLLRDKDPEKAIGLLNLIQKSHGLPTLPDFPIGGA